MDAPYPLGPPFYETIAARPFHEARFSIDTQPLLINWSNGYAINCKRAQPPRIRVVIEGDEDVVARLLGKNFQRRIQREAERKP